MIISLLAIGIIISSFSFYSLAYQITGMNRLIIYTPITEIEKSVKVDGNNKLHFSQSQVSRNLSRYYNEKITEYTKDFEILYYFYNKQDHSYCMSSYCDCLEVDVTATLFMNYHYHRVIYFEVKRQV